MNRAYTNCRESGFLWVFSFAMIAMVTVTTCIKQEKIIAEKTPLVVAMRSN
jgi:hypothetical protein